MWCDATSIATGVVLEVNGVVAEDAAWLRKKDDAGPINITELDVVHKGINLALKKKLREICVRTDSATIFAWLNSVISKKKKNKDQGNSGNVGEMPIGDAG